MQSVLLYYLSTNGYYQKLCKIIPFIRFIGVYENAVFARPGNFLVDGPKETILLTKDIIPESASYGVKINNPVREHDRFDLLGKVVGKNHPNEIKEYLQ